MSEVVEIPSPEAVSGSQHPLASLHGKSSRLRLAVLMTSHNRRDKTLGCLSALLLSKSLVQIDVAVILVDDGSSDGTADAVASEYRQVEVIHGDGSLFWNRGMHTAFAAALAQGHDYYLWLNDDTVLEVDAVWRLITAAQEIGTQHGRSGVVVGSTRDPRTGKLTYGAQRRSANPFKPLSLPVVEPTEHPQLCDTMNGNIVLIPAEVARVVGNLDVAFEHAMGDTDYGFRVRRAGFGVWLAPGYHGHCSWNAVSGSFGDADLPLLERWRKMMGPKGLPWRSWLTMTRRHAGMGWPIHFVLPYVKLALSGLSSPTTSTKRRAGT
jgi:GT2 family glycosyltransferase